MKKIFLLALLQSLLLAASAQPPLTGPAFRQMMTDLFNFTLTGNQTPTTGFKVETEKPTIGIKGNIYNNSSRDFIMNLELQGGLDNNIMQLVSGKQVNTSFKAILGFNFLLPYNSAWFPTRTTASVEITDFALRRNREKLAVQLDSFCVLHTILKDVNYHTYSATQFRDAVITLFKSHTIPGYIRTYTAPITEATHFETFIKALLEGYKTSAGGNFATTVTNFNTEKKDVKNTTLETGKLLADYERLKEFDLKDDENFVEHKVYDADIEVTKKIYNWKNISWINVTLTSTNSNFKLYNSSLNTLIDSSSFLPAITLSHNRFRKGRLPHQFQLFRTGITLQRTNSLVDLPDFAYNKETVLTVSPGETLKSTKSGTAYQGELLQGLGIDLFFESYAIPWKKGFIPGFYLKSMYQYGSKWINKNKLSLDLGFVWNVNNNDKDAKNILTIVPYIGWSNFLKEYKDVAKTDEKKLSDLFGVGIKFSVPVNLGK